MGFTSLGYDILKFFSSHLFQSTSVCTGAVCAYADLKESGLGGVVQNDWKQLLFCFAKGKAIAS